MVVGQQSKIVIRRYQIIFLDDKKPLCTVTNYLRIRIVTVISHDGIFPPFEMISGHHSKSFIRRYIIVPSDDNHSPHKMIRNHLVRRRVSISLDDI